MNNYFLTAAFLSFLASLLHFACIVVGAPLFRLLGAGDAVIKMLERGSSQPKWTALIVACALLVCSAYALSSAGAIMKLPLQRIVLVLVATVLILRALAFPWMKEMFAGNSELFWWTSSALCLLMGLLHVFGLIQVWDKLT